MTKVMPEMKCEHLTKNEMKVAVETRLWVRAKPMAC